MRIWDIDPGFLNDKSLLGEHREIHGLANIHIHGKKGYSRHPETLRWKDCLSGIYQRHRILVSEMKLRGFNHHSPLPLQPDRFLWPSIFIDSPAEQFSLLAEKYRDKPMGRIPLPRNAHELWANYKYSVMSRDPALYRKIGPMVAASDISFEALAEQLVLTLRKPPETGRLINGLDHMWGYVSKYSLKSRKEMPPAELLEEIATMALANGEDYLTRSTALGELGAWLPRERLGGPADLPHPVNGRGKVPV